VDRARFQPGTHARPGSFKKTWIGDELFGDQPVVGETSFLGQVMRVHASIVTPERLKVTWADAWNAE
jgi:hypothetical protein